MIQKRGLRSQIEVIPEHRRGILSTETPVSVSCDWTVDRSVTHFTHPIPRSGF